LERARVLEGIVSTESGNCLRPAGVSEPNFSAVLRWLTQSAYKNTMPASLFDAEFQAIFDAAKRTANQANAPFPSPPDWRDQWIYFLMVDRFNNKAVPPRHQPFDDPGFSDFQGGKFSGIMDKLPYLKDRKSTRLNSSHVAISYAVF